MSAGTIVDLGNQVQFGNSIAPAAGVGSTPASGEIVGLVVDMLHANSFCNLAVTAGPSTSGQFRVQVQTSDSTASGTFTDPTSGLEVMPTRLLSGGIFVVNSGNGLASGGMAAAGFLRPHRYVRARLLSGDQHNAPVAAAFISQLKRTGSGDGYTFSPASGVVGGF